MYRARYFFWPLTWFWLLKVCAEIAQDKQLPDTFILLSPFVQCGALSSLLFLQLVTLVA